MNNLQLLTDAQQILEQSMKDDCPKTAWEIGFRTLSLAQLDWKLAVTSIRDFFKHQAANGYLPCPTSAQDSHTIVHTPIWGAILWKIYQNADHKDKAIDFLKELFPKIVQFHHYLYQNRDIHEEGLCFIQHPLEDVLKENLHWNNEQPFKIQDPFFNAILIWSNEMLIRIAEVLEEDVTELVQWYELGVHTFNEKLWDEEFGIYNAWDLITDKVIPIEGITGILPLIGGIPDIGQALQMLDLTHEVAFSGTFEKPYFICPSHSLDTAEGSPIKQHQGAISLDLNWLLHQGLQQYETPEFMERAEQIKKESLMLLSNNGFFEFFDARKENLKNAGMGKKNDVISAAVLLNWL